MRFWLRVVGYGSFIWLIVSAVHLWMPGGAFSGWAALMAGLVSARVFSKRLFRRGGLPEGYGLKAGLGFALTLIILDFLVFGLTCGTGAGYLLSGLPPLLYGGCIVVAWAGAKHL